MADDPYLVNPITPLLTGNRTTAQFSASTRARRAEPKHVLETNSVRFNIGDYVTNNGATVDASRHPVTLRVDIGAGASYEDNEDFIDPAHIRFSCSSRWVAGYGYNAGVWSAVHGDDQVNMVTSGTAGGDVFETFPEHLTNDSFAYWHHTSHTWVDNPALIFSDADAMFTDTPGWSSDAGVAAAGVFILRPPDRDSDLTFLLGFSPRKATAGVGMVLALDSGSRLSLMVGDRVTGGSLDSAREVVGVNLSEAMLEPVVIGLRLKVGPDGRERADMFVQAKQVNKHLQAYIHPWSSDVASVHEKLMSCELGVLYSRDEERTAVLEVSAWFSGVSSDHLINSMGQLAECYGVSS